MPATDGSDAGLAQQPGESLPELTLPAHPWWATLDSAGSGEVLARALSIYLARSRWYGARSRQIARLHLLEAVPWSHRGETALLALVHVAFVAGPPEVYFVPLFYRPDYGRSLAEGPSVRIARVQIGDETGALEDAVHWEAFRTALLEAIGQNLSLRRGSASIVARGTRALRAALAGADPLSGRLSGAEQSNTSIVYGCPNGDRFILKLFRRLSAGAGLEVEMIGFLTRSARFANVPALLGTIECRGESGTAILGILQPYIPNRGDAWAHALVALEGFWRRFAALDPPGAVADDACAPLLRIPHRSAPSRARTAAGDYLDSARLLGRRTAELHLALASGSRRAFQPEPLALLHQRRLLASLRSQTTAAFELLASRFSRLPDGDKPIALAVLDGRDAALARLDRLAEPSLGGMMTRTHGDLHLGQVLVASGDFVFVDFEGEPARPIRERRAKTSPLRDVAGMLRSFDYAAHFSARERSTCLSAGHRDAGIRLWRDWVGAAYLGGYLDVAGTSALLPAEPADAQLLLDAYLWEKAIYELVYELNNRPAWAGIPLSGLAQLLGV